MFKLKVLIEKFFRRQFIRFHITSKCNHNCCMCSSSFFTMKDKSMRTMTLEEMKSAVDKFNSFFFLKPKFFITGGEPFLADNIVEISNYMASRGNRVIIISTLNTDKSILSRLDSRIDLIVSLHGKEAVHDEIVGTKDAYSKAIENMKVLNRKGNRLGVNSVVLPKNYIDLKNMLNDILEYVKDFDVQHLMWKKDDLDNRSDLLFSESDIKVLKSEIVELKKICVYNSIKFREFGLTGNDYSFHYLNFLSNANRHSCINRRFSMAADGNIFSCFRDNLGNVINDDMSDIVEAKLNEEDRIRKFMSKKQLPERCVKCYNHLCDL